MRNREPEGCFLGVFLFVILVNIAWIGVLVWAIIQLVNHFTS